MPTPYFSHIVYQLNKRGYISNLLKLIIGSSVIFIITFTQQVLNVPPLKVAKASEESPKNIKTETIKHTSSKNKGPRVHPETSSEAISWNFFIKNGFSAKQTAGILGNLKQEHNFNTHDVHGGLGIAQWLGGRRSNLLARKNPYHIKTQLQFILDEFKGPEIQAYHGVKNSKTIEDSTIAFQNLFERCGDCRQETRIQYSYYYLKRFSK